MIQITNPHLPFGGVGKSGMGRYHGRAGFEAFSYAHASMRRSLAFSPYEIAPPYRDAYAKLRKWIRAR